MNKKNVVTSYTNPDTDGIACAIALAAFLSKTQQESWIPAIGGTIGAETEYVLDQLCISKPVELPAFEEIDKLALVDTHHRAQLALEFPYNRVVFIVDHHPNGDDLLFPAASIINEKIGAAASIVAEMYFREGIIANQILRLLGFAILSNTLHFTAPSTTEFDKLMYEKINNVAPIEQKLIAGMFKKRAEILEKDIYSAMTSDFKIFECKVGKVGISQIEAYDLESRINIKEAITALNQIAHEKDLQYCLFNGVDIKTGHSIVLSANEKSAQLLCHIFHLDTCSVPLVFDRILLRKTDFIPALNT